MNDGTRITIFSQPTSLLKAGRAWVETFGEPGTYYVEMLKAAQPVEGTKFDEWFLEALSRRVGANFTTMRNEMWEMLDRWIAERGYRPSEADFWELESALFDLSRGATAHMVGLTVPAGVTRRLEELGFRPEEQADFPALAYRLGRIYERLQRAGAMSWGELVAAAHSMPLTPAEGAAITIARQRAGVYLKPIFDEAGRIWTADREIRPLRRLLAEAGAQRQHPREVARALSAAARAEGNFRDMERVARTEIADMRSRGSWQVNRPSFDDAPVFRHTSTTACDDCIRLYKQADGMPRLYTVKELESFDALGPNTGPREGWVAKVGPTHPNCNCSPWQRWYSRLADVLRPGAERYAERQKGVA